MCGCVSSVQTSPSHSSPSNSLQPCTYTKEQAEIWRQKLLCIDRGNLYSEVGINRALKNKYLGALNSIVLYNNNPCYFQKELNQINDLMLNIINLGICQ